MEELFNGTVQATVRINALVYARIAEYAKGRKFKSENELYNLVLKAGIDSLERPDHWSGKEIPKEVEILNEAKAPKEVETPKKEVLPNPNPPEEKKTEQISFAKKYSGPTTLGDIKF